MTIQRTTKNKLVNQKTHFPSWYAYDQTGKYVGKIEKDIYGNWYLHDAKGHSTLMGSFAEARSEASDYLHA